MKPIVYLMCGMPASGKSTTARSISAETGAIHFSLDQRMISKHAELTIHDDAYGQFVAQEKRLIWQDAQTYLADGLSVILDWSLWNRGARREWVERVTEYGYEHRLIYLDLPLAVVRERLAMRNNAPAAFVHVISLEEFDRFSQIFEPPSADELINLQRITT